MADVRKRICDATRTVFMNEGVDGISMRRIAASVGITPTAIYRHFTDKNALVTAIVDEGFSILENKMRRATRGRTGRDTLMRLLDGYVDFALAYPQYYDFMFLLPRTDVRRYPEDFRRRESATFNILLDIVSEVIESGEFRQDDALEASLSIWSHAHGIVSLYRCGRFGDHPIRFRRSFRRSVQRLFDGLVS
ncbi:MAG: TetR/AcrR family transcriptional regulator [Phycisphaerales bacterium]|nr:MAG: TetR/AcrR family transcriptional regulator [Phycisphaerales bacterium]